MISIVVPAHNEEAVIQRCLSNMLRGAEPGELEVIVVCNGCSDRTYEIAGGYGEPVRVIDTEVPSKSNALNLGDRAARGYPRFFVDADIILGIESIRRVADVLRHGQILGAAPRLHVRLDDASWAIRAYYKIWTQLPYVTDNMLGSGVYAVSENGRRRFDEFPDIIADDAFIHYLFDADERLGVDGAVFQMMPPKTIHNLIHVEVRRRASAFEMRDLYGDRFLNEGVQQRRGILKLGAQPGLWASLGVYGYVKIATRIAYAIKRRQGLQKQWNRDDSSRNADSIAGTQDALSHKTL